MKVQERKLFWKLFEISDLTILFIGFLCAVAVFNFPPRTMTGFGHLLYAHFQLSDVIWIFILTVMWHLCLEGFGLYHNKRLSTFGAEAIDIFKATAVCIILYFIVSMVFMRSPLSLRFVVVFWGGSVVLMLAFRLMLRSAQRFLHLRNRNLRFLLIVGTNQRAINFARKVLANPELGYRLAGFADDEWPGMAPFREEGFETAVSLSGIFEYLRRNVVDEVFVALPVNSFYNRINKLVAVCEEQGIVVHYMQDSFNRSESQAESTYIGNTAVVRRSMGSQVGWKLRIKHLFDVLCASFLLMALSPVFIAVAVAIKLTSEGPVFFKQKRIGLNKRLFTMYKFRTMVSDAELQQASLEHRNEVSGPVFKIRNDPRVTPLGAFLRKTSLDELPQLLNVLLGDMSIIGPRPLPLRDYSGFPNDRFRRRLSVRPGITCIWQASGRNDIPFERWMEMDLAYIDKWSLSFDLKILFRTVVSVMRTTGAS